MVVAELAHGLALAAAAGADQQDAPRRKRLRIAQRQDDPVVQLGQHQVDAGQRHDRRPAQLLEPESSSVQDRFFSSLRY